MSDTTTTAPATVDGERARIARDLLAWAQRNGYTSYAASALREIGLGDHLPRQTAEVQIHVTGTVTVRCNADGTWTQDAALYALESAVRAGRAVVETSEVEPTGAPEAQEPVQA